MRPALILKLCRAGRFRRNNRLLPKLRPKRGETSGSGGEREYAFASGLQKPQKWISAVSAAADF